MNDLVSRLCESEHPVEIALRPTKTITGLKQCIDRGYVHVKFIDTKGGTELGVRLDRELTNTGDADFETGTGQMHVVGTLTLDYVKVRCLADIELSSFAGRGKLELVDS